MDRRAFTGGFRSGGPDERMRAFDGQEKGSGRRPNWRHELSHYPSQGAAAFRISAGNPDNQEPTTLRT